MAEQKSLQLTRVSELDPIGSDRCGSGCLLAPDLLLTAAHVVGPVGSSCDWRRITDETGRMTDWRRARVAWCSEELDGALLVSADGAAMAPGMLPIRLGRLTGDAPIIVQAVGFPTSHARHDGQGLKSDTCQVFATVMPLSDLRDGPLRMNVLNAPPLDRRAWGGVSGAALFAHGVCLGWIVQVPEGFGSDALKATRVHMLAADSEAAEHLRRAGIVPAVLAVDASGVAGERRERYAQAVLDVFCTPTGGGWAHLALRGSEDGLTHSLADLASTSSVIVLGAPGAGKSTLLQQALARATRDGCMPLWLPLNTLPAEGVISPARIVGALVEQAREGLGLRDVDAAFIEAALEERGGAAVAFDALDEAGGVARRGQVRDAVAAFARHWSLANVWLSSRHEAYRETPLPRIRSDAAPEGGVPTEQGWLEWHTEPMDPGNIAGFLRDACGDNGSLAQALAGRHDLQALTASPLTLRMLADVTAEHGLPDDPTQVFARWVHLQCSEREEAKGARMTAPGTPTQRLQALRVLAFATQQRYEPAAPFTQQQARQALDGIDALRDSDSADAWLEWAVRRSGLVALVRDSARDAPRRMRFVHLQIQEYLAGKRFATLYSGRPEEREITRTLLRRVWRRADWLQPLGFATSELAHDGDGHDELLAEVLGQVEPYADLLVGHRELLALQLLGWTPRADEALVRRILPLPLAAAAARDKVAFDALLRAGAHRLVTAELDAIAAGRGAAAGKPPWPRKDPEALRWRLAAALVVGRVRKTTLPHAAVLEKAIGSELGLQLELWTARHGLGEHELARTKLRSLFDGAGDANDPEALRARRDIAQALDAVSEKALADQAVRDLLTRSPDAGLPVLAMAVERCVCGIDDERVVLALERTQRRLLAEVQEPNPSTAVADDLGAAWELAERRESPALRSLILATLQHQGLVWYHGLRVRQRFPDSAPEALDAMVAYALQPVTYDRSRLRGVIVALVRETDPAVAVPRLLALLQHRETVLWGAEEIVHALARLGGREAALAALQEVVATGMLTSSDFGRDRFRHLIEELKSGTVASATPTEATSADPPDSLARAEADWTASCKASRPNLFRQIESLSRISDMGGDAIARADSLLAPLMAHKRYAMKLIERLLALHQHGLWHEPWTSLLADALRRLPDDERPDYAMLCLAQHA